MTHFETEVRRGYLLRILAETTIASGAFAVAALRRSRFAATAETVQADAAALRDLGHLEVGLRPDGDIWLRMTMDGRRAVAGHVPRAPAVSAELHRHIDLGHGAHLTIDDPASLSPAALNALAEAGRCLVRALFTRDAREGS